MTFDSIAFNKLASRITASAASETINLCAGGAADHPSYREVVGYLRALREVEEHMNQVESEMRQGK